MAGDQQTDTGDAEQAAVFRDYFGTERDDLVQQRAKLTNAVTAGNLTDVAKLRRAIPRIENSIRGIDRMLDGLDRRFPGPRANRRVVKRKMSGCLSGIVVLDRRAIFSSGAAGCVLEDNRRPPPW